MLVLAALLAGSDALAIQRPQSGPVLELGVGPGLGGAPAGFALAGQFSAGWWAGPYDEDYALGRFWSVLATGRVDWMSGSGALRVAPLVELRHGMDLFVVAPYYFAAAGPVLDLAGGATGGTLRVGGGIKLRRSRTVGLTARLGGGADYVDGALSASVGFTLGIGFSAPVRTRNSR